MKNILTITKKELSWYFNSPIGYILLALFVVLANFLFVRDLFVRNDASMRPFFEILAWLLLFLTAAVAMRAFAPEKRSGAIEVLMTLPVTETAVVLGKFFASLVFAGLALLLTASLVLTLNWLSEPELGVMAANYLGSLLMIGVMLSVGIFISSLMANEIGALLTTVFVLFFSLILGSEMITSQLPRVLAPLLQFVSLLSHFDNFVRGVIDVRDVIFYLSATAGFLFLTVKLIERRD